MNTGRIFLRTRRPRVSSPAGTAFSGISTYHSDLPSSLRDDNAHHITPAIDYQSVSQAHFNELEQYLFAHSATNSPTRVTTTSKKLTRLTVQQFQELATDVYDEVRRKGENGGKCSSLFEFYFQSRCSSSFPSTPQRISPKTQSSASKTRYTSTGTLRSSRQ
ncbi:hypothetical protein FB45DRAFT_38143 [Roridomyces roridus]|uniref:GIT Spa2 homology (SHD) domain-containing protein n=1 Tax=Roridomyces roridus TaxID=1738132 RepID=A0AAD7FM84_9AGAR|nr:hypothetical protein FB45DRAFT_38143 [Roridomyces roridus]